MNIKIILFLLSIVLFCNLSFAQDRDSDRKIFKDEIESVMKQKLIDSLGFDATTADKFFSLYKENNEEVRSLSKEKKTLMKSIEEDPSAIDVGLKIDKMMGLETEIAEKKKNFYKELESFLSAQQIAKTLILRKKFGREIRKEFKKYKKKGKL